MVFPTKLSKNFTRNGKNVTLLFIIRVCYYIISALCENEEMQFLSIMIVSNDL